MKPDAINVKNAHRAAQAARRLLWRLKLLLLTGVVCGLGILLGIRWLATPALLSGRCCLAAAGFIALFFRDPTPHCPDMAGLVVAPAHGRVDAIEGNVTLDYLGVPCHRISLFLSIFDVHVQNAPVAGTIELAQHISGKFINALSAASSRANENLLIGIRSSENTKERLAVGLIAGFIARCIVPWVQPGEPVAQGDRLGLILCGSRCDLFLPLSYRLLVRRGDKVVGGETPIARRWAALVSDIVRSDVMPSKSGL